MIDKFDAVDLHAWEIDYEFEQMYLDTDYNHSAFYSPEAPIFY